MRSNVTYCNVVAACPIGTSWHAMVCHGMPWHAMACHGMPWHTMACLGMPWHAYACHGMKERGTEPAYSNVVAACPKAATNPATGREVTAKRLHV